MFAIVHLFDFQKFPEFFSKWLGAEILDKSKKKTIMEIFTKMPRTEISAIILVGSTCTHVLAPVTLKAVFLIFNTKDTRPRCIFFIYFSFKQQNTDHLFLITSISHSENSFPRFSYEF